MTTGLVGEVDRLYASVVEEPDRWNDERFEEWASDLDVAGLGKDGMRALRQCLRMARRLREFWASDRAEVSTADWQHRVDVALGVRAWRPTLDLAMAELAHRPGEALFDDVKQRFRLVNGTPWLDGVDYSSWRSR